MKIVFTMMALIALTTGCVGKKINLSDSNWLKPRPIAMSQVPKGGSPEYTQGWKDGCETGSSTMVQGYYKSYYQYKQDIVLANNPVYYKAWKDAYTYCRQYTFRYSWDAFDRNYHKAANNPLCVICPNELDRAQ